MKTEEKNSIQNGKKKLGKNSVPILIKAKNVTLQELSEILNISKLKATTSKQKEIIFETFCIFLNLPFSIRIME